MLNKYQSSYSGVVLNAPASQWEDPGLIPDVFVRRRDGFSLFAVWRSSLTASWMQE